MILLSELSRRRIRSVQKLIRVGRNEVVVVLRVDEEKGKKKKKNHELDAPHDGNDSFFSIFFYFLLCLRQL